MSFPSKTALLCLVTLLLTAIPAGRSFAAGFQLTPITFDLPDTQKFATLEIRSDEEEAQPGQIRVFRWIQKDGVERLEPTKLVGASPPAFRATKGRPLTVRIVRVATEPVIGEECYRILVDQVAAVAKEQSIGFQIRQSLPLCFFAPNLSAAKATWTVNMSPEGPVLVVGNTGDRRLSASELKISTRDGAEATLGRAVVLGKSRMSWPLQVASGEFRPGSSVTIRYKIAGRDFVESGVVSAR
jgi:fimbrial chaperone protein